MSPTSYRTALLRDIKMAEEKGFEPLRRLHDLPVFKTGPFNQTWVFLRLNKNWCLRPDLNRHEWLSSQDFKSCASTNSATQAKNGDPYEIRTHDPLIKSQVLYRLS